MSRYLIFATVCLAFLLSSMSSNAIAVAFPVITTSLNISLITAGWVLSIYQLTYTAAMPLAGKASDAFGRKFVFLFCIALFTLGSLLCSLAPNIGWLILFRFIQGVGGAGFLPSGAGIVAEGFPEARQRMIGLFSSILPIGQILGPNIGGWMTEAFGWRSIFLFNVPLCLVALVAGLVLLRPEPRRETRMDLPGALLFTGMLAALMLGLGQLGADNPRSWQGAVLLFAASAVLLFSFIRRERKAAEPVIDLHLLQKRQFAAANIYNLVYGACNFGIASFVPLYAVSVYGMSTIGSGFLLTPRAIGMMLAATLTSIHLVRWGYRRPILIGTILIIITLFLLGAPTLLMPSGGTAFLFFILLLSGLGLGTASPAANNACIDLMPERVATIVGLRGMFRQTGGAVSIAVITLILHNVGDMTRGFTIVFLGLGIIFLIGIPIIFAIPGRPRECTPGPGVVEP